MGTATSLGVGGGSAAVGAPFLVAAHWGLCKLSPKLDLAELGFRSVAAVAQAAAPMSVYMLHLSELAAPCAEWSDIVAGGAARVLNALPPRRRSALFGRPLPFRVIVVDQDCCPVLVIEPDMIAVYAACHGRLNGRP